MLRINSLNYEKKLVKFREQHKTKISKFDAFFSTFYLDFFSKCIDFNLKMVSYLY